MLRRMVRVAGWFVLAAAVLPMATAQAHWVDAGNVLWTTPSKDAAGSMPMGNGAVGINLWVEDGGDLRFYISRTDSLSEISRLLKVGSVRVALAPNPFAAGAPFKQELILRDGVCIITAGEGAQKVTLRVFVDSDRAVVHVTGESASPLTVKATADCWRTAPYTVGNDEKNSAWSLHGVSFALNEAADIFPPAPADATVWYHRNESAIAFESTIKVQSLESIADKTHNPLLHRTFGGWLTGAGFAAVPGHAIATPVPVQAFALRVAVPCEQTSTAQIWMDGAQKIATDSADAQAAQAHTAAWWHAFWDRGWVITDAGRGQGITGNQHPLRIGFDSGGGNKFPGTMARVGLYGRALSASEIAQLAAAAHDQPAPVKDGLQFSGEGSPRSVPAETFNFSKGLTAEAWINPAQLSAGRIVDRITAGGSDGFLFDMQSSTLRLIVGSQTHTSAPGVLTAGQWHHVAATVDPATGGVVVYLNGKAIIEQSGAPASPIFMGYTLQRYMQACGGRGKYPIKFNGGMFTVEPKAMGRPFNADYRAWGDCHWWQNVRHMYFPMPAGGDVEMMQPLFNMYEEARPLAEARSKLYYDAQGAYFPETMTVWGTYANGDYAVNRTGKKPGDVGCPWWQYAWNQGLELSSLLLDRWDYTDDEAFLKQQALPMAESVLKYFDTRFKKDADGRILIDPTQAVETYWHGVVNDMPATAGLNAIATRLCALPERLTTSEQRAFFAHMKAAAPVVPVDEVVVNGQPVRKLAPAQKYDPNRSNCENPELYAVWPFRLYGLGKPGLDEARAAYAQRHNHLDCGWGYDGNCAAVLGLTDEAARILKVKCANSRAGYRWPATWGPNYDWLPDQNHGGNLLETTELMLLQADGNKLLLLPAWPKEWDVSFKLHAPHQTVVECVYRSGKIEKLQVTPEARRADIVLP